MAHWICWAIASEREFMVFVMVLVAAATFLAIGAIADWMSLPGPTLPSPASVGHGSYLGISCRQRRSRTTVEDGRVEMWRGGFRLNISVCRPFRLAVP
jgi:hypothetical protein